MIDNNRGQSLSSVSNADSLSNSKKPLVYFVGTGSGFNYRKRNESAEGSSCDCVYRLLG